MFGTAKILAIKYNPDVIHNKAWLLSMKTYIVSMNKKYGSNYGNFNIFPPLISKEQMIS